MKKFIEIQDQANMFVCVNVELITHISQGDKFAIIYFTDGTKVITKDDYPVIASLIAY